MRVADQHPGSVLSSSCIKSTYMANPNPMSSASWRVGLMRQSIASYFSNKKEQEKSDDTIVEAAPRNESNASSSNHGVLGGESPGDELEKNGMYKKGASMHKVDNEV